VKDQITGKVAALPTRSPSRKARTQRSNGKRTIRQAPKCRSRIQPVAKTWSRGATATRLRCRGFSPKAVSNSDCTGGTDISTGGFQYTPNIDAVVYFVKTIYPLEQALPAARFYVIGDKAPPEVIALANESVITTGLQPDIRPYFDSVKTKVMFSSEAAQKQLANLFSQSHLSSHPGPRLSNDSAGFTSRDAERVGVVR
jgi:hypothetical protein